MLHRIRIDLPDWIDPFIARFLAAHPATLSDDRGRMALAIALAAENVRAGTGGPFGAAVFARRDGRLLAVGVNRVLASHCSSAHAEMVALALAQQGLGEEDLRLVPGGCVLATSAEPCAMCMGAIPWSGIESVLIGARDADVRAIGYDEGHKPADWPAGYARRGIAVTRDLRREEASAVLRAYLDGGGVIQGPCTHPYPGDPGQ